MPTDGQWSAKAAVTRATLPPRAHDPFKLISLWVPSQVGADLDRHFGKRSEEKRLYVLGEWIEAHLKKESR